MPGCEFRGWNSFAKVEKDEAHWRGGGWIQYEDIGGTELVSNYAELLESMKGQKRGLKLPMQRDQARHQGPVLLVFVPVGVIPARVCKVTPALLPLGGYPFLHDLAAGILQFALQLMIRMRLPGPPDAVVLLDITVMFGPVLLGIDCQPEIDQNKARVLERRGIDEEKVESVDREFRNSKLLEPMK
ncbi:hypothetical protein JCM11641_004207 [Rhodosporidiobolus odoratus]